MRVLQLIHQYPPEHIGGTEFYTQWLSRELVQRGHDVAVFHRGSGDDPDLQRRNEEGVRIWTATHGPMTPNNRFRATFGDTVLTRAFARVLAAEQPDLVHVQHVMGLPHQLVHKIRTAGIPYVVTLHDYYYVCANAQLITNYDNALCDGPSWWLNCARCALARAGKPGAATLTPGIAPLMALRQALLRPVLANAACVIAPTEFVREIYGRIGIPTHNMQVVTHGIALPDKEMQDLLAAREPYQAPPLRVAYIGGLSRQKGVHVLITAVNQLSPQSIRLSIYGDTKADPDYVKQLRDMSRHPGIHFNGRIPRDQIWAALAQTDLVVVPSLWYETSSLIIQEAFAAGVPVIASRLGGMVEKVVDGVNGYLVQPDDARQLQEKLTNLCRNPGELAKFRENMPLVRPVNAHVDDIEIIYQPLLNR